jgi:hypothetical protein
MIEALSQMHLAIAAALMTGGALIAAGMAASLYFLYERIIIKLVPNTRVGEQQTDAAPDKPKAAHA